MFYRGKRLTDEERADLVEKWWVSLEPEQRKSHKRAIERHFERPTLARTEGKGERE